MTHSKEIKMKESSDYKIDANFKKKKLFKGLKVIIGDIKNINLVDFLSVNYFDCIVFADILEHLKNPWGILKNSKKFLNGGGGVISSIPNVKHYTTIANLLLKDIGRIEKEEFMIERI